MQDRFSEGILKLLLEIGHTTVEHHDDYEARSNHVWASTLALNGLIGVGVPQDWATHVIGHEITALTHIAHGRTLAIVLPSLLEVCKADKFEKLLQYARRVWHITEGTDEEKVDAAIGKTREFFGSLGVPTRLSQYGIEREAIDTLVNQLKEHGRLKFGERGNITPAVS